MNKNEVVKKIMLKRLDDILEDIQHWQSKFDPYLKGHHTKINEHKDGLIVVYNSLAKAEPGKRTGGE